MDSYIEFQAMDIEILKLTHPAIQSYSTPGFIYTHDIGSFPRAATCESKLSRSIARLRMRLR